MLLHIPGLCAVLGCKVFNHINVFIVFGPLSCFYFGLLHYCSEHFPTRVLDRPSLLCKNESLCHRLCDFKSYLDSFLPVFT